MNLPHGIVRLELGRPLVMGILNVTPDSFSDGGQHLDFDAAVRRAEEMVGEGADLIDVGPESTRPGAEPVAASEQIRRAVPVIERIRRAHPRVPISIDTRRAAVAGAALDAGADIVNDISALRDDAEMGPLVAARGAGLVLMHMQGSPATMQKNPAYTNVVEEILAFLRQQAAVARGSGVADERIILDPGIGFGKTVEHNLEILRRLDSFVAVGAPILLGASRKRFLGQLSGGEAGPRTEAHAGAADVRGRLGGSLACVGRAVEAGVAIVRVHDVRETRQFIDALSAMSAAS